MRPPAPQVAVGGFSKLILYVPPCPAGCPWWVDKWPLPADAEKRIEVGWWEVLASLTAA